MKVYNLTLHLGLLVEFLRAGMNPINWSLPNTWMYLLILFKLAILTSGFSSSISLISKALNLRIYWSLPSFKNITQSTSHTFYLTSATLSPINWTKLGINYMILSFDILFRNWINDFIAYNFTSFSLSLNNWEKIPIKFISVISLLNASIRLGKF